MKKVKVLEPRLMSGERKGQVKIKGISGKKGDIVNLFGGKYRIL